MTLRDAMVLGSDMQIIGDIELAMNSSLASGSAVQGGSLIGGALRLEETLQLQQGMTLTSGSMLAGNAGTLILANTVVGGAGELAKAITLGRDLHLAAGSLLAQGSALHNGSTLGGEVTLAHDETVADGSELSVQAGSRLAAGSILSVGTLLTSPVRDKTGGIHAPGTVLAKAIVTSGETLLGTAMTLQHGSLLVQGSTLTANQDSSQLHTSVDDIRMHRLSTTSLLSQDEAQTAIAVADAALVDLNRARSDLGSVQNQIVSTIANFSTTKVNIFASESQIRDSDYGEEAAHFSKLQILTQVGAFALAQANITTKSLLNLVV
jgi:flagellin